MIQVGTTVDVLVGLWNEEMAWAVDMIRLSHPFSYVRTQVTHWFTEELQSMKRQGRLLVPGHLSLLAASGTG